VVASSGRATKSGISNSAFAILQHRFTVPAEGYGVKVLMKPTKNPIRRELKNRLKVLKWQRKLPRTTPLTTRIKLLTGGFTGLSQTIYNLDQNNGQDYLSDLAVRRSFRIMNRMSARVMDNKLLTPAVLQNYFDVPDVLAVIAEGEISSMRQDAKVRDVATLLEYCRSTGGVILKPSGGLKGKGVISLKAKNECVYISERKAEMAEVPRLISGLNDYQIESFVEQAAYAAEIYPHVTNTMRVLTMRDPERGDEPFIAFAIHKFGTTESAPVDNWAKGGLNAYVDLETGKLGPAVGYPDYTGGKLTWFDQHPETGEQIAGVYVPDWLALKEQLLDMLRALKFLMYIGWDIVITPQGPCIIEGNTGPAIGFLQVHKPLLKDPRIKRFYAYHNVI
jgi:hypothetical protein